MRPPRCFLDITFALVPPRFIRCFHARGVGETLAVYTALVESRGQDWPLGSGAMTAALILGVLLLAGMFAEAVWEKRGRPMPHVRELELPLRGRAALGMGIALVVTALTIIVLDLTLMSLMS